MPSKTARPRSARSNDAAALREHVVKLLDGGHAHAGFDDAVRGIPSALRNRTPRGLPYSPWQLLEHLRIAQSDLFTPFPWGDGQTLLREALLVADHNAYHLGQLIVVRRLLGAWK